MANPMGVLQKYLTGSGNGNAGGLVLNSLTAADRLTQAQADYVAGKIGIQESITAALVMPVLRILVWISFHFRFRRPFKKTLVESISDFNKDESKSFEPSEFEKSNIMQAYSVILITTTIIFLSSYAVGYWASSMLRPSRAFVLDNSRYAVIRDYDGVVIAKEIVEGRIGEKYIYVDSSQNKLIFYPIHVDNGTIR